MERRRTVAQKRLHGDPNQNIENNLKRQKMEFKTGLPTYT